MENGKLSEQQQEQVIQTIGTLADMLQQRQEHEANFPLDTLAHVTSLLLASPQSALQSKGRALLADLDAQGLFEISNASEEDKTIAFYLAEAYLYRGQPGDVEKIFILVTDPIPLDSFFEYLPLVRPEVQEAFLNKRQELLIEEIRKNNLISSRNTDPSFSSRILDRSLLLMKHWERFGKKGILPKQKLFQELRQQIARTHGALGPGDTAHEIGKIAQILLLVGQEDMAKERIDSVYNQFRESAVQALAPSPLVIKGRYQDAPVDTYAEAVYGMASLAIEAREIGYIDMSREMLGGIASLMQSGRQLLETDLHQKLRVDEKLIDAIRVITGDRAQIQEIEGWLRGILAQKFAGFELSASSLYSLQVEMLIESIFSFRDHAFTKDALSLVVPYIDRIAQRHPSFAIDVWEYIADYAVEAGEVDIAKEFVEKIIQPNAYAPLMEYTRLPALIAKLTEKAMAGNGSLAQLEAWVKAQGPFAQLLYEPMVEALLLGEHNSIRFSYLDIVERLFIELQHAKSQWRVNPPIINVTSATQVDTNEGNLQDRLKSRIGADGLTWTDKRRFREIHYAKAALLAWGSGIDAAEKYIANNIEEQFHSEAYEQVLVALILKFQTL